MDSCASDINNGQDDIAKMNQIVILLAEKQEKYRTTEAQITKANIQVEIDGLQSDLHFIESKQKKEKRIKQMDCVQLEARELFKKKNDDYGDAFANYGTIGVLVRVGDKISRLQNITQKGVTLVEDEKLRDTLIDLHNYAAMAIMLLDEK